MARLSSKWDWTLIRFITLNLVGLSSGFDKKLTSDISVSKSFVGSSTGTKTQDEADRTDLSLDTVMSEMTQYSMDIETN